MDKWEQDGFLISTNKAHLDIDVVHAFLNQQAYWSRGIPKEIVIKSIEHTTLCFGVFKKDVNKEVGEQVGFARVISDLATFAYLADVFILPNYRNLGLSKWLMETIVNHNELQSLRRFMLATRDAHTLYNQYGFEQVDNPEPFMQKVHINPYQR
ncbi:MAG: GNAT family N-acetyltransferase [Bacillaceae bacterium]